MTKECFTHTKKTHTPVEGVSKNLPPQDKEDQSADSSKKDHFVQRSKKPTTLPTQKVALRTPPPLPIQTFVTVPTSGLVQPFRDINPTKSNIYAGEKKVPKSRSMSSIPLC
ncbi:hypothetical protein P5673_001290 [Acropora cervicornis]|uniref:Uncharacterized protein n=1 Tax=Acropora cervicornis TaxID=6130 RepID=A0AAD9VGH5_ACRCE|nr:hypothetical protein P5673_001290 [Acropora cervicornis]